MLKAWHDVVVECGENPKMLLAAAFVNASTNYAMAYSIVPRQQFNGMTVDVNVSSFTLYKKLTFHCIFSV